ncbi:MAG: hypothetical protein ACRC0L_05200 [Angustibacter sp.]
MSILTHYRDLGPVARSRGLALTVSVMAAALPTVLAAQGMVLVGVDVLALPLGVAIALAAFLELALVGSALMARSSVLAGRSARIDATATWVFSAISGVLSATHELVGPVDPITGARGWEHDSASLLAALVRLVAPMVAAWLWERTLVGVRHDVAVRSHAQVRQDRRMLVLARAALAVRRLEASAVSGWRTRWARRRMDRANIALLRHMPATDESLPAQVQAWLAVMGSADHYPDSTKTAPDSVQNVPVPLQSSSREPLSVQADLTSTLWDQAVAVIETWSGPRSAPSGPELAAIIGCSQSYARKVIRATLRAAPMTLAVAR